MYNKIIYSLSLISISLIIIACSGEKMPGDKLAFPKIEDVPTEKWEKLAQKKIFFGHKSVGDNIVEGIQDVLREHPVIKIDIVETTKASDIKDGVFAHSMVGKNGAPKTKIDSFVDIMSNGTGEKADIAALKFCWADMMERADVNRIFSDYHDSISKLRSDYPDLTVVHFTAPLTTNQTGIKAWFKKLFGRPVWGIEENIKRNRYSAMILNRYSGKEPVFDIASIESTYPNGTRAAFTQRGETFYFMVPEYTPDHGHLNEIGRKKVAEQLLIYLAENI